MAAQEKNGPQLEGDMSFIQTPPAQPSKFKSTDCGVAITNASIAAAIPNAPLPAEGSGNDSFPLMTLGGLLVGVPISLAWFLGGGFWTSLFFFVVLFVPILVSVWYVTSRNSPRINTKAKLPGRPVEEYLTFKKNEDRARYNTASSKIPMEDFIEKYLDGEVDFNGDALDILEYRHDWASWAFTWNLFKFIFAGFGKSVLFHTREQDEEQIKPTYDAGNDHYSYFLGPRMVYTSGIISDPSKEETLEEMQDNKMSVVCEKLDLKEGETLLDIGCGWGSLARFAAVNYGANVTGVTISPNQAAWGNDGLRRSGVPESRGRILCSDYRDIPEQKFNKISQIEMGEHVGIKKLTGFFRQCSDMLADDGAMYVQLSGLRRAWQYEDLIWGLYLNKFIFPGADASTPLWYYVSCLESAGFEVKSIDTVGVHYSGTLWRWYRNWVGNAETVRAKFGERWYRIWELFLAWSTIASRQGSATCFQFVVVKNLNATHRIDGVLSQHGIRGALAAAQAKGRSFFPKI